MAESGTFRAWRVQLFGGPIARQGNTVVDHFRSQKIAALFAYLASDDAAFATGHVYVMDGAETAGGLASR